VLRLSPASASCRNLVWKNQFCELHRHILTLCNKSYCEESHTLRALRALEVAWNNVIKVKSYLFTVPCF
jgi:hypothetical protein